MIEVALTAGTLGLRSVLFAPAARPELVAKALRGAADAVVVDLEDGVAAEHKDAARYAMATAVAGLGPADARRTFVRVNPVGTAAGTADLLAVGGLPVRPGAVVVPRADPAALASLPVGIDDVVALVETARGVRAAETVAGDPRVRAVMVARIDLAVDLDASTEHGTELIDHAVREVALRARAAGCTALVDGPCADYTDIERVRAEVRTAMSRGFWAKACIHPAQLDPVHATLRPSTAQCDAARSVLAAYEEACRAGHGAGSAGGRMVDAPVVARARQVLRREVVA